MPSPHDAPNTAGPPVERAAAAVEELLGDVPGALTDEELRQRVTDLHRLVDRAQSALVSAVDVFDARTVWIGDGARSAGSWISGRIAVSRASAAGTVRFARGLRSCPLTAEAYGAGSLGSAKARLLVQASRVHLDLFVEHEADLHAAIAPLTVDEAASALAHWARLAENTKDEGDNEADPAERNSFRFAQTLQGRWFGELDLDPVTGAELHGVIAAYLDRAFQNGTYAAGDDTTASGRAADALIDLALRGADPTATKHGRVRPSASITIDHKTLTGIPADDVEDGLARRCHLNDGTPISRSAAERLLCTAAITAIATQLREDGTIEAVGITDLHRHATAKQRTALALRDGGCAFPGCHAPVDWCDAHHLTPHSHGGPTLLHNMVLLCRRHHHLVHEGNWRLWRTDDGTLHLHDPTGQPVPCTPHGHLHPPPSARPQPPPAPPPPRFRRPHEPGAPPPPSG